MEIWSIHHFFKQAENSLGNKKAHNLFCYVHELRNKGLPVIFSLAHLSKITGINYGLLYNSVQRKRERVNYKLFRIRKRSSQKWRFIHSVRQPLFTLHQFINSEILQKSPLHPAAMAFHRNGGIKKCAAAHCGARFLFQFDLADFFYSITEIDVYKVFRDLGYKKLLAFELARLCTTTHLPKKHYNYLRDYSQEVCLKNHPYKISGHLGVLPQGAPTSPMLSNLVAARLDEKLSSFALQHQIVYTRYADDITLSMHRIPPGFDKRRMYHHIVSIIRSCHFRANKQKFHFSGPGSRKMVLGLLVDGEKPRLSKKMRGKIDNYLYALKKYQDWNAVAQHYDFRSSIGFYNHLLGMIAFVKDVDFSRWNKFNERLAELPPPPWN